MAGLCRIVLLNKTKIDNIEEIVPIAIKNGGTYINSDLVTLK
jgi:hypothetical protein